MSCFDFLEENACTALVSRWDGPVAVVDRRTPGLSSELSVGIGFRRTRTVHVHPLNRQYFLAAGSTYVPTLSRLVLHCSLCWGQLGLRSFSASIYSQSCLGPFRKQLFSP